MNDLVGPVNFNEFVCVGRFQRRKCIYLKFKTEMSTMSTMCAKCMSIPHGQIEPV